MNLQFGLLPGGYDAEWVVMDEGTKHWIDHEDVCPILTISTSPAPDPTPTSQPTFAPTATGTVSLTPYTTPPDDAEVKEAIEIITSVVEETMRKILDLLKGLL